MPFDFDINKTLKSVSIKQQLATTNKTRQNSKKSNAKLIPHLKNQNGRINKQCASKLSNATSKHSSAKKAPKGIVFCARKFSDVLMLKPIPLNYCSNNKEILASNFQFTQPLPRVMESYNQMRLKLARQNKKIKRLLKG